MGARYGASFCIYIKNTHLCSILMITSDAWGIAKRKGGIGNEKNIRKDHSFDMRIDNGRNCAWRHPLYFHTGE